MKKNFPIKFIFFTKYEIYYSKPAWPQKPPLATITLDDADSSGDEVEIDVKNNTFRQKNSYKTQSVITSTGGRCLNAPNQKKKYSDISSQDNSILENSEQDEKSVSKKCQNNKGLADIEDISSDEVVIESVKSEKSTQQSRPSNSFLNHLQSWKDTSNDSKPVSTPKNAAFRVTVKDETDCSVKKRKSLSRQHSSSSSSSSRYCHNITSCHLNFSWLLILEGSYAKNVECRSKVKFLKP